MKKIRKNKLTNYSYIHQWNNENHSKSGVCMECRKEAIKTEWALIHGLEHSRGTDNYRELCISCHRKYDAHPAWNKGMRTYRKCEQCEKDFYPRRLSSKFCSNICSGKWRFKQGLTKLIPGDNEFNRLALHKK